LGNVVARVMQLAQTHLAAPVELPDIGFPRGPEEYADALSHFEFNKALDVAAGLIQELDQKITKTEPFKLIKTDPEAGKKLIAELVVELAKILVPLQPVIPTKGHVIWMAIQENKKPENLFPRKD
jgi:methionyl-tRNA synthetase